MLTLSACDHRDRLQIQDFAGDGSLAVEGTFTTSPNSLQFDTPVHSNFSHGFGCESEAQTMGQCKRKTIGRRVFGARELRSRLAPPNDMDDSATISSRHSRSYWPRSCYPRLVAGHKCWKLFGCQTGLFFRCHFQSGALSFCPTISVFCKALSGNGFELHRTE